MTTTLLPAMIPVGSSNLKEIGYDSNTKMLYVRFQNGTLYGYEDVPQHLYDDFFTADSMGSFYHSMIKGAYIGGKVNESI